MVVRLMTHAFRNKRCTGITEKLDNTHFVISCLLICVFIVYAIDIEQTLGGATRTNLITS